MHVNKYIRRVVPIAAVAITAAGFVMATSPAHAATPSCGGVCVEPYTHEWGSHQVFDVFRGRAVVNQPIILWRLSNSDAAEDFVYSRSGSVPTLVADGILPKSDLINYSGDTGFELEYSPYGANSGLCVSTWADALPSPGFKLRLEPCGVSDASVWIVHNFGLDGNDPGFGTIVSGITTTFGNHPLVITYPAEVSPFDVPRPIITVNTLGTFSSGQHLSRQQIGARFGVAP